MLSGCVDGVFVLGAVGILAVTVVGVHVGVMLFFCGVREVVHESSWRGSSGQRVMV